jgi:hypothetical protein
MKKLLLITLLLPLSLLAQENDSTNALKYGGYVSFNVLGARDLSTLNDQLRAAGQLPVLDAFLGFSVGFTSRFADQNSYTGARLSLHGAGDTETASNQQTRLWVGELGSFSFYDLVANPNWLVGPYLGFGFSYARLAVSSVESNVGFQSSLANPASVEVVTKRYGTDGLMLYGELGAGVERVLKLNGVDFYIGLSGGYRLSTRDAWMLDNTKVFDTSFGTQGWTFELKYRFEARPDRMDRSARGLIRFFK